jgi:hypothetical protein
MRISRAWARKPWALLGILLIAMLVPGRAVRGEVRILEVVGAIPIRVDSRRDAMAKEAAVQQGLWEGVSRVAESLMDLRAPSPPPDPTPPPSEGSVDAPTSASGTDWETLLFADEMPELFGPEDRREREREMRSIQKALGAKMVSYTKTFRIVEDQGERPALFTQDPDAATEYVVVMEVEVEVERVRDRLEAAGLVDPIEELDLKGIEVEIRGLSHYRGYRELLDLLADESVGAVAVSPRNFSPQRATIRVEGDWGSDELLARLQATAPAHLSILELKPALGRIPDGKRNSVLSAPRIVLAVEWAPPWPDTEAIHYE